MACRAIDSRPLAPNNHTWSDRATVSLVLSTVGRFSSCAACGSSVPGRFWRFSPWSPSVDGACTCCPGSRTAARRHRARTRWQPARTSMRRARTGIVPLRSSTNIRLTQAARTATMRATRTTPMHPRRPKCLSSALRSHHLTTAACCASFAHRRSNSLTQSTYPRQGFALPRHPRWWCNLRRLSSASINRGLLPHSAPLVNRIVVPLGLSALNSLRIAQGARLPSSAHSRSDC